jgi:hypothetical protein
MENKRPTSAVSRFWFNAKPIQGSMSNDTAQLAIEG